MIEIEPASMKPSGRCACCGKSKHTAWGFVYEDDAPKNARPTLNMDALTALPTTLLEANRNAAQTTNITVLLELAREVEPISPAAADALNMLLSEFNYATIIEMIDRHFQMR